jgi:hypothetical protein
VEKKPDAVRSVVSEEGELAKSEEQTRLRGSIPEVVLPAKEEAKKEEADADEGGLEIFGVPLVGFAWIVLICYMFFA